MTVLNCCSLMHGPISVEESSPLPTFSDFTRSTNRSTNSLYTLLWTAKRLAAVQRCPVVAQKAAPDGSVHRQIEIGVIHDNDDVFAAHFQAAVLKSGAQVFE